MKKPKSVRTTFSTYVIREVLGEGGSGIVYSGVDEEENEYAIKCLDPAKATREKLKRFKNEFSFCSKTRHPHILSVVDNGITKDDTPFFVMPLYDGSLRRLMGKISVEQGMDVFGKILDGVDAAHKLGVIHRDIKPENILINGNAEVLVVADFGIARFEEEDLFTAVETKDDSRLANFQYAAPEQRLRGRDVDHSADIYSLCLIMNEIITGEVPYGTNFKLITEVTDLFRYLDGVVEKMLAQDPHARYGSIEDIKRELIARGEEHISLQKVSELEKVVIPAAEVDHPIVKDPMRIVNVDWADNVLTINCPISIRAIRQDLPKYTSCPAF